MFLQGGRELISHQQNAIQNIRKIVKRNHEQCSIIYQSPVISGPRPENNGPPPLTLGPEVEICWLLSLTLEPSADMHLSPSTFSPNTNSFN